VKTPDRDRPAICFQPAVERGFPIYPVAIAYSSDEAAYVGETSFVESLVAVVSQTAIGEFYLRPVDY